MSYQIRKAIFPAAGLGTRFLPATKAQPKEMLPLVDKPLIQYAIEEACRAGLEDCLIVTGRGKGAIEDHFDHAFELEHLLARKGKDEALEEIRAISDMCRISYVRQKEALGLGHAVSTARPWLADDEAVAVLLADDILDCEVPCMKQMLDAFQEVQAPIIAAMEVPADQTHRYGIFEVEPAGEDERLLRVRDMVEKPPPGEAPSNLAAIGRYVLTPEVFQALEEVEPGAGGEIQLTDALRAVVRERPVYAYRFAGTRFDGGDKVGFLQATISFALKNPALRDRLRNYLKSLQL